MSRTGAAPVGGLAEQAGGPDGRLTLVLDGIDLTLDFSFEGEQFRRAGSGSRPTRP